MRFPLGLFMICSKPWLPSKEQKQKRGLGEKTAYDIAVKESVAIWPQCYMSLGNISLCSGRNLYDVIPTAIEIYALVSAH